MTPKWMPPHNRQDSTGYECEAYAEKYALAAVKEYKKQLVPVAWITKTPHETIWLKKHWSDMVPLYRLDGGDDE